MPETAEAEQPGTEAAGTEQEKQEQAKSAFERLGGDALRRIASEIDKNPRFNDARGRLDRIEKSVLNRLNIASLEDVAALREEVASLEARLAKAEATAARRDSKN